MSSADGVPLPILNDEPRAPFPALDALMGGEGALPRLRPLDDRPGTVEAFAVLERLLHALKRLGTNGVRALFLPTVFSLGELSAEGRKALDDTLGEGEVLITVTGSHVFDLRETSLAGVWRVRDRAGGSDFLEVGDVPSVVRAANEEATCGELSIGEVPPGAMNVLPVLAELRHRMKGWTPGGPNHVISFTLLPMNEVDMRTLEGRLGHGPVQAESRGYGSCKVELTGHRHLWSVQYFNRVGAVILDTLEVGDVPVALTAAAEDFEDSATRLAELLGGP